MGSTPIGVTKLKDSVAQLVELFTFNEKVADSSSAWVTNSSYRLTWLGRNTDNVVILVQIQLRGLNFIYPEISPMSYTH